jgi:hypothetical protein
MMDETETGRYLEASGHSQHGVLSCHFPGGAEQTTKASVKISGYLAKILTEYNPNTSLELQ